MRLGECKKYDHEVCIITYDQPLYAKARAIVAAAPEELPLSKIIVRLVVVRRFSFNYVLPRIDWLHYARKWPQTSSFIHAPNSVDRMLNGCS